MDPIFDIKKFYEQHGWCGNTTSLFDDMLQRYAASKRLLIKFPEKSAYECIKSKTTYCVSLISEKKLVEIPIPTSSKFATNLGDECLFLKDFPTFIVRGHRFCLVASDDRNFSEPIVTGKDKKDVQAMYILQTHDNITSIAISLNKSNELEVRYNKMFYPVYDFMNAIKKINGMDCDTFEFIQSLISKVKDSRVQLFLKSLFSSKDLKSDKEIELKSIEVLGKPYCLMYMIFLLSLKLAEVLLNLETVDDLDNEEWKIVDSAGTLFMTTLTRKVFELDSDVLKKLEDSFFYNTFICRSYTKTRDMAQEPPVETPMELLSFCRRVKTYANEETAAVRLRLVNPAHAGLLCLYETAESKSSGLNKSLASTALLSISSEIPENVLYEHLDSEVTWIQRGSLSIPVFYNSVFIGTVREERAQSLFDDLDELKRSSSENNLKYIGYHRSKNSICILSTEGRLVRPLLRLGKPSNWIEMVDMASQKFPGRRKWKELYSNALTGIPAGSAPFYNMTQSPRVVYHASMSKQALSNGSYKWRSPFALERILEFPHVPVVASDIGLHYIQHFDDFRDQNVLVAYMANLFNNEDAIIVNKDSVERGMFCSYKKVNVWIYKSDFSDPRNIEGVSAPNDNLFIRLFNIKCTDESGQTVDMYDMHGTINKGITVSAGETIQTILQLHRIDPVLKVPIEVLHPMKVISTEYNIEEENHYVKITLLCYSKLEVGDKLETLHSQKGIVCKMIPRSQMPYTESGVVPDIIINPHSIPSRMTVSTLLAANLGLEAIRGMHPVPLVADPFVVPKTSTDGYVTMYNEHGKMQNKVFLGVLPYRALRHQIKDKSASRRIGPVDLITGQPVSGRKRGGGSRSGGMEIVSLVSHGVSGIITQRMRDQTAQVEIEVCTSCYSLQLDNECNCKCEKMKLKTVQPFLVLARWFQTFCIDTKFKF